ncbi:MAG: rRNA maturation RNase YbeY [Mariprofundaceae bacterium]
MELIIDDDIHEPIPSSQKLQTAIAAACHQAQLVSKKPEVCIRFANNTVVQQLNQQWRDKDKVTDVLSFPMQDGPDYDTSESLGDIILAVPFVHQEATRLELDSESHILHLIIHAILHLLAYDHIQDEDAIIMQELERQALSELNLHNPYPHEISPNV